LLISQSYNIELEVIRISLGKLLNQLGSVLCRAGVLAKEERRVQKKDAGKEGR